MTEMTAASRNVAQPDCRAVPTRSTQQAMERATQASAVSTLSSLKQAMSRKSVFISYASENRSVAESIALSLRGRGIEVFFDKDNLAAGRSYDGRIKKAIESASVFIFLVSPQAVAQGRYTMTELKFARQKWPHPDRFVLPVLVSPTDMREVPEYLKAVSIMKPHGSIAAEVGAEIVELFNRSAMLPKIVKAASSLLKITNLGDYLKGGIGKSLAYTNSDLDEIILKRQREEGGRIGAGELKDKLKSSDILRNPMMICVNGVYFPSALMSFGWWERSNRQIASNINWRDPALQQWLFSGFEQWAPSWDVNDWSNDQPFRMVGQIGQNDEADSVPVLVKSSRKARKICEDLHRPLVVNANVIGLLCHEQHLHNINGLDQNDQDFLQAIKELTSSQYYILLLDDEKTHKVEVISDKVDYYSGYIWQCWAPKEWTPDNPYDTRLPRAYFVWEHTNLADKDVIKYSLDSLDTKVKYLRRRLQQRMDLSGDLVLLQHLMSDGRLRGDDSVSLTPEIPTEHFRNLFMAREEPERAA